jgi:hypothetical protein
MTTGEYIKNALFYFIKIIVLIAIIGGLLEMTGYMREDVKELILGSRGALMLGVLIVWSAVYTKTNFVKRTIKADITADRASIIEAVGRGGYAMTSEETGRSMTFRASSMLKKAWLAFGDKITVTAEGENIIISGIRKEAVQAEFRIEKAILQ